VDKQLGIQTTKAYVKEIGEEDNGYVIGIASTSDVDRDGDIIDADGWLTDDFNRNPVWLYAHDTKQLPIGIIKQTWQEDNTLMFRGDFGGHTFGQDMRLLHQSGILKTFSVRFDPVRWEYMKGDASSDWPGIHYHQQKLIEISSVPIPANIEAELQSAKELRYNKLEKDALRRLKVVKDIYPELLGRALEVYLKKMGV